MVSNRYETIARILAPTRPSRIHRSSTPSRLSRLRVPLFQSRRLSLVVVRQIGPHAAGATVLTTLDLDETDSASSSLLDQPRRTCSVSQSNWTSSQCLTITKHPISRYTSTSSDFSSCLPWNNTVRSHRVPHRFRTPSLPTDSCDRLFFFPDPETPQIHPSQWPISAQATSLATPSRSRPCPSPSSPG